MLTYCPKCGREVSNNVNICPYCGQNISEGKIQTAQTFQQPKQKYKSNSLALILVIIIIAFFVIIAISATVYVYVSGMIGSPYHQDTIPEISFNADYTEHKIVVTKVDLENRLSWEQLSITGICDSTGLTGYIEAGQQIINCEGSISIIYMPTNTLIAQYTFE